MGKRRRVDATRACDTRLKRRHTGRAPLQRSVYVVNTATCALPKGGSKTSRRRCHRDGRVVAAPSASRGITRALREAARPHG